MAFASDGRATSDVVRRAALATVALASAAAVLLAPIELCFVAIVFHLPCPGCGMTRAAFALAHGDFARALALHPLSFVVTPWMAWLVATHLASYVRTGGFARPRPWAPRETALVTALVVMLVAVWGARFFGFFGGPVPV